MTSLARLFIRNRKGSAMMEFGLLTPVVVSFIIGAIELGMVYLVSNSLENAVLTASRYGITGNTDDGSTREEQILEIVSDNTFGLVDMEEVAVDTIIYDSFSDIGTAEPFADENGNGDYDTGEAFTDVNGNGQWDLDVGVVGLGGAGDIVLYRIDYTIQSMTGLFEPIFGRINHSAAVAVRNEPF